LGNRVREVGVGGIVRIINSNLCSVSLADALLACISGGGLIRVLDVAVDQSEKQSFVFVVVLSFALVNIVVGVSFIGIGIGVSTLVSSAVSPVSCGNDGGLLSEEVVARASSIVVFSVVLVVVVISIVCVVGVSRIVGISSLAWSEISIVGCVSGCGLRRVEGLAIDVFSVLGGCSVVVIVSSGIWKSPILSWSSSVNCSSCCGW